MFLSTNLDAAVAFDICGEPTSVPGGVGGGLDFGYHIGNVTFVAPATVGGKPFEFWYVVLPSHQEKSTSDQLTLYLPAGLTPSDSMIEAF